VTGQRHREIHEKGAGARPDQDRAKQNKQQNICRHHEYRNAEDAIGADELDVDKALKADRRRVEDARKIRGVESLGDEKYGDEHHCPADRAAGGLEHHQD